MEPYKALSDLIKSDAMYGHTGMESTETVVRIAVAHRPLLFAHSPGTLARTPFEEHCNPYLPAGEMRAELSTTFGLSAW